MTIGSVFEPKYRRTPKLETILLNFHRNEFMRPDMPGIHCATDIFESALMPIEVCKKKNLTVLSLVQDRNPKLQVKYEVLIYIR